MPHVQGLEVYHKTKYILMQGYALDSQSRMRKRRRRDEVSRQLGNVLMDDEG